MCVLPVPVAACKQLKVRCDRKRPCSRCEIRGTPCLEPIPGSRSRDIFKVQEILAQYQAQEEQHNPEVGKAPPNRAQSATASRDRDAASSPPRPHQGLYSSDSETVLDAATEVMEEAFRTLEGDLDEPRVLAVL
jgi:hypothetical protein